MAVVDDDIRADAALADAALPEPSATGDASLELWRNRLLAMILGLLLLTLSALAARVVVPVLVAILFSVMLAPAVRLLTQWRVPRAFASLLILGLAIAAGGVLLNALAKPAVDWIAHAPKAIEQFAHQVQQLWRPIADASKKATEQIAQMTQSAPAPAPVRVVDTSTPDTLVQMLSAAPGIIMEILVTLLLTFVFLQHGDAVLRKLVELAPDWHAKRGVVVATRDAQRDLSVYVFTISVINAVLGIATATALWALGIPDAVLWGGVAAAFNFAPYIGPMLTVAALSVVGITNAHSLLLGLAPPAAFLALHFIESFVVTPFLAGRRLALDPIMIFLSLLLFGWMWGIAGLLIAVPLLTCLKIIASRVPAWAALAKLLGT
jgi:predicted PurR-regulated permease PerM